MNSPAEHFPDGLVLVVTRIMAHDPKVRELAADELCDFVHALGQHAAPIAGLLVVAYLSESEKPVAESQLNCLADICGAHRIPIEVVDSLLNTVEHADWELEYIDAIREAVSG